MKHILALAVLLCFSLTTSAEDVRLQPLEDLNGYFPFNPPESLDQWEPRKEYVRRQILVAAGLWPMPTFLNKHFKLGFTSPVIEQDFEPLPPDQLTVVSGY